MKVNLFVALTAIFPLITALGQSSPVTTTSSTGFLRLDGRDGQILLSAEDWWGVIRAAGDLATDFGKVTGHNLTLGGWSAKQNVTSTGNGTTSGGKYPNGTIDREVLYAYRPVTSFVNVSLVHLLQRVKRR